MCCLRRNWIFPSCVLVSSVGVFLKGNVHDHTTTVFGPEESSNPPAPPAGAQTHLGGPRIHQRFSTKLVLPAHPGSLYRDRPSDQVCWPPLTILPQQNLFTQHCRKDTVILSRIGLKPATDDRVKTSQCVCCFVPISVDSVKPIGLAVPRDDRRTQAWIARTGGRARMGLTRARRSLAVASRAGQAGRMEARLRFRLWGRMIIL